MFGIDTNVLIRCLVADPSSGQPSELAAEMLETASEDILVNPVVLAELAWVLESRFNFKRRQVGEVLDIMLAAPALKIEHRSEVEHAIGEFQTSRADFADCLIAALNHAAGCHTTLTFDKAAAKGPYFTLLS